MTPSFSAFMPDFGPMLAFWGNQAELATYVNTRAMRTAMVPWQTMTSYLELGEEPPRVLLPKPTAPVSKPAAEAAAKPAAKTAPKPAAQKVKATPVAAEKKAATPAAAAKTPAPTEVAAKPAAPKADAAKVDTPKAAAPNPEAAKPAQAKAAEAKPAQAKAAEAKPAETKSATPKPVESKAAASTDAKATPTPAVSKPKGLSAARPSGADNLREIKGVGPKLEEALNALGIYHYDQIAAWTPAEVAWSDDNVPGARGRVSRDGWVAQASKLSGKG